MKTKEVNFSLSHLFIFILMLSCFSTGQVKTLFAYDEHSGQAIEPVMTAPQSEGAKIVSSFEYEPIEFTPPKPERLVWTCESGWQRNEKRRYKIKNTGTDE